jgi:hypothetical protein
MGFPYSLLETNIDDLRICGVFFLFKDDKLVFVGKSTNLTPIVRHYYTSKKLKKKGKFNSAKYIEMNLADAYVVEALFISEFKPELNHTRIGSSERTILKDFDYDALLERATDISFVWHLDKPVYVPIEGVKKVGNNGHN